MLPATFADRETREAVPRRGDSEQVLQLSRLEPLTKLLAEADS
jgi:hypothetical protein